MLAVAAPPSLDIQTSTAAAAEPPLLLIDFIGKPPRSTRYALDIDGSLIQRVPAAMRTFLLRHAMIILRGWNPQATFVTDQPHPPSYTPGDLPDLQRDPLFD
jgi:hypothetical protein